MHQNLIINKDLNSRTISIILTRKGEKSKDLILKVQKIVSDLALRKENINVEIYFCQNQFVMNLMCSSIEDMESTLKDIKYLLKIDNA